MGNTIAPVSGQSVQDLPSYLHDLPMYAFQSVLGRGKVLKSLSCLRDGGHVVMKLFIKQYPDISLKHFVERAQELHDTFDLLNHPGVLPPSPIQEFDKAAFMISQFFASNLYDRFHTHPYLSLTEKKWLTFQLLTALTQMHQVGVCHGDIKSENVMLTSWTWLFLTDIAFYKPTFLPADNPADFKTFFEVGQRRRCYLAPERFYNSSLDGSLGVRCCFEITRRMAHCLNLVAP